MTRKGELVVVALIAVVAAAIGAAVALYFTYRTRVELAAGAMRSGSKGVAPFPASATARSSRTIAPPIHAAGMRVSRRSESARKPAPAARTVALVADTRVDESIRHVHGQIDREGWRDAREMLLYQNRRRRPLDESERQPEQAPRQDLAAENPLGERAGSGGAACGHGVQLNRSLTISSPVWSHRAIRLGSHEMTTDTTIARIELLPPGAARVLLSVLPLLRLLTGARCGALANA